MDDERLAIIREVGIGNRDIGTPCMFFTTYISEGSAALQVLSWKDAYEVIKESGVSDVDQLEGRPCWVKVGRGTINFLRVAKI